MQPQAARDFYATQQRVSQVAANEVRRIWKRRMGDDFDSSWRRIRGPVLDVLLEAQMRMAEESLKYLPRVLDATDLRDRSVYDFNTDSLVGLASDGRPLETLADQAVTTAKTTIIGGGSTTQGISAGGDWLHLMAQLQVADVARIGVGIGVTTRTDLGGYVRCLNPPVCQRCAVLGGRVYRWSQGFDRHPRDDCTMTPVKNARWARAEGFVLDPQQALREGFIKDLTESQLKAIGEGADLSDVVNAYRGMSTTATERGLSQRQLRQIEKYGRGPASVAAGQPDLLAFLPKSVREQRYRARLTPEGIYRLAGNDRAEAIRLLRREGYIS